MCRLWPLLLVSLWSQAASDKTVLIVGIDGFGAGYRARYNTPNLRRFIEGGAQAQGLIPCYPSTTFPNFYTIATGLPPAEHGIVEMDFYDPDRGERWYYRQRESTTDGSWYGGVPIWVAAERAGVRAATLFWPGADAEIRGRRPSFYRSYDGRVTHEQKLAQLREWLAAGGGGNGQRPRLLMMYFSDVDAAGHRFGPGSVELRDAVEGMDRTLGRILEMVGRGAAPVDVLIVSDHGMTRIGRRIDLSKEHDFSAFRVINDLFMVQLYSADPGAVEKTWAALRNRSPLWTVYRRAQLAGLGYSGNKRIGDLVVIPNGPYLVGINHEFPEIQGMHGYDPKRWPEMHGVLYGRGSSFAVGARIPAVSNLNIHGLVAEILGIAPAVPVRDSEIRGLLRK